MEVCSLKITRALGISYTNITLNFRHVIWSQVTTLSRHSNMLLHISLHDFVYFLFAIHKRRHQSMGRGFQKCTFVNKGREIQNCIRWMTKEQQGPGERSQIFKIFFDVFYEWSLTKTRTTDRLQLYCSAAMQVDVKNACWNVTFFTTKSINRFGNSILYCLLVGV